jgi:hypothetical protein
MPTSSTYVLNNGTGVWSDVQVISGATYASSSGVVTTLQYRTDEDATAVRGRSRTPDEVGSTAKTTPVRTRELNPKLVFSYVKSKLNAADHNVLRTNMTKLQRLIPMSAELGQIELFEELATQLTVCLKEQEAAAIGCGQSVKEEHLKKFISVVKGKCIKFTPFSEFPRTVPRKPAAIIKDIKAAGVFDDFHVLYTDYVAEAAKDLKTTARKIREKDPIVFGTFLCMPGMYFYVTDWIDEYCDITLSSFVTELKMHNAEFELDTVPEVNEDYVKRLANMVTEHRKMLAETRNANWKEKEKEALAATEQMMAEAFVVLRDDQPPIEPLPVSDSVVPEFTSFGDSVRQRVAKAFNMFRSKS